MRNLASPRSRTPMVTRALPATVALMLVLSLGWLVAPATAAAQDDDEPFAEAGVSGDSYESPTYGYTLEWDDSVWQVEEAESDGDNDFLYLASDASDLYFESYERFDGDAADCRDNAVSSIEEDDRVTEFERAEEDDDDDRASATFSYVVTINDEALPMTQYSECRVLVDDEAVLQIDHLAPQDDYESESDLVAEVIDTLVIPGAATTDSDDADEESEDADDSDGRQSDDEEEATAAASDDDEAEPTEEATDDDTAADEDEPTPTDEADEAVADDDDAEATEAPETSEDEDEDAEATEDADTGDDEDRSEEEPDEEVDPEDLEGVDDDSYTSPTFGYSLEWDDDEWTATAATSEDDVDTLVLENDISVLTIVGTEQFGENLDRCVRSARRGIERHDDIEDVTPVEDADGDPIEIDEDERAGAVFSIVSEDEDAPDQVTQIECRVAIPGDAVIQIVQITPAADFNDQIDPVREILDSITVEGDEEEEETPVPDDEPTPDDDGEEEEAESGVDANSYVSPNFGYSIEWDEDVWTFADGDESSEPGFDTLFLESANSGLGIIGAELRDPETCVSDFSTFIRNEDDVDDWAPFEDEDGERIEGERDDGYFAAFSATITSTGQELEIVYYFECRTVVERESVVLFFMTTSPNAYDDAVEELDDLLETLTLPGDFRTDEDEETPSDDVDEDTEPTPDEEEDNSDSTARGADLDTYTDPDFPYSVTWDESVWSVIDQRTIADGHNLLNLAAEDSDLTIEGWARWEGEPTDCLNDITLNLRAIDGVEDFARVSDSDLYPENESAGGAYALYSFTLAPEGRTPIDYYGYVECRTVVEGEAVVVLTLLTPADEYEEIRPDFEPILASIEIDE